ncbi:TetR/AcrR family transcriptional regulator [Lentzea sp. NPDC034063]|uniref:TetR/AcrR family transcriptional regulator n=1 Tax=unclassified Lentzea TaxID=2643253 RepID=UPI0033E5CE6D
MAGKRSDARQKMVSAARELFREQGYHATALSDVLKRSEAPRGSVYFHFPGGKAELAAEAADEHTREQVENIDRAAADATTAGDLVRAYLGLARTNLTASDYRQGCTIAPLVIESTSESDELDAVGGRSFTMIIDALAGHFSAFGIEQSDARLLAHAVLAGAEGALITARSLQSTAPFDAVQAALEAQVATVQKK